MGEEILRFGKELIMKRKIYMLCVAFMTISLSSSPIFSSSPLGPPVAGLEKGQYRLGADYGYMEGDIDLDVAGGEITDWKSNTILANLGFGVTDNLEVYGLLGASDGDSDEFDSSYEPAYGFGVKATLGKDQNLSWGLVYQMLWVNPEDEITGIDVEIDTYDIKAAIGLSCTSDGFQVYGGPMLYYIDGDVEASGVVSGFPVSVNADIDQDVQIGGYAGLVIDLAENMSLMGEYQYTHDVETIGVSLCWKF